MLDVVTSTAPDPSPTVSPLYHAKTDFSPLLTDPSVNTIASQSLLLLLILGHVRTTANPDVSKLVEWLGKGRALSIITMALGKNDENE